MKQAQDILNIHTRGEGHHDITGEVRSWVTAQGIKTGLLVLFVPHVMATLTIRQTSDRDDLFTFFRRLEGDDDLMPRPTPLYTVQTAIPVREGDLVLGARQGLYLHEQRDTENTRQIVLHLLGM